ncbi:MAG: alpha/beta hydrolase-fold protein [Bryobacteraceae bacterium]
MRRFLLFVFAFAAVAQAQPPAPQPTDSEGRIIRAPGRGGPPPVVSPEVLPDRRVTFRLRAPKANEVVLTGELSLTRSVSEKMTRDAEGIWSVTVGPLVPDIYGYSFVVDGVTMPDPVNGWVKPSARSSPQSMVRVPGEEAAFLDVLPVPHGEVRIVWFKAESIGMMRRMRVYLPPGYDTGKQRYPVLYLIHGAGEDDEGWTSIGMANIILDNLIAQGKAKPMIVVMPSYQGLTPKAAGGRVQENYPIFARSFAQDILPFVEKTYRVIAKPEARAFGGLSPPDIVPDTIIPILDKFNYWLCTSNGLREGRMAFYDKQFPGVLSNPANTKRVKLLMGDGSNAMTFTEANYMAGEFKRRGYDVTYYQTDGWHSWPWFRRYLNELAPKLFR